MRCTAKDDRGPIVQEIPEFTLSNGIGIPAIGLGTYPMNDEEVASAIVAAHEVGYSLFDTSSAYGNERGVGKALNKNDFITTKISNLAQRDGKVWLGLQKSRIKLRRRCIDLLLLHWPYPGKIEKSWRVLESCYRKGVCRAIGVANFKIHHLEELMRIAKIRPMVDQFERHPLYQERELTEFCIENEIIPEAYTPFARMDARLFEDERLLKVASDKGREPTQIILRWNYQHGVVSIPKTSSIDRMRENASIFDFELSKEEMSAIDSMECNGRVRYDPDNCDFDKL